MSAPAQGWVWLHSPYTGAGFTVHLAIGDIANDANRYELWALPSTIATKARVHPGTVRKHLLLMVEEGYLELLEDNSDRNRASRYRFLMPEPVAPHTRREDDPDGDSVASEARPGRVRGATVASEARPVAPEARPKEPNERKTNENKNATRAPELFEVPEDESRSAVFNDFWSAYPRKVSKPAALKAWAAIKMTPAELRAVVVPGAERYRDDPNRDDSYTAHPSTWLRGERWNDPPLPPRPGRRSNAHATGRTIRDRTDPSGEVSPDDL